MGIFGTLWVILIVLKAVGVIAASWTAVLLWPLLLGFVVFVVLSVFGIGFAGFASFRRR